MSWSRRNLVGAVLLFALDLCWGETSTCQRQNEEDVTITYTCPDTYVCCEDRICCFDYPTMIAPWLTLIVLSCGFIGIGILSCWKCQNIGIFKEKQRVSAPITPIHTTRHSTTKRQSRVHHVSNRRDDDDAYSNKSDYEEEKYIDYKPNHNTGGGERYKRRGDERSASRQTRKTHHSSHKSGLESDCNRCHKPKKIEDIV